MIRRLILINVMLLIAIAALALQLRKRMELSRERENAMLLLRVPPADIPKPAALAKVAPLDATSYQDVVLRYLFSPDRNPTPIPDPPPPAPPPDPVPSFPVARGVMLWDGVPPTIVMSMTKGGSDQRGYHPGDSIGPWKIVSVDTQFVALEWRGQQFKKRIDELMDYTPIAVAPPPQQAQAAPPGSAIQSVSTKSLGDNNNQGPDMGGGVKACVANDGQPAGAVVGGLKKVISQSPFSPNGVCRWEPVGK